MFALPLALGSLGVKSLPRHSELLGALVIQAFHAIVRTGSLGVRNFSRHRELLGASAFKAFYATDSPKHVFSATWSSWESWRQSCVRVWAVWGREPWRQRCVRHCVVVGLEGSHHRPY